MRVLVTGHNGYIGSVLAPLLQAAGHQVVGLDCCFFEQGALFQDETRCPEIRKDVRQTEASDLAGFDAVIHLAGLSNDPLGDLDPKLTAAINREASRRLAHLARAAGIRRFLFSSSCSVYGANDGDDCLTETAPWAPLTPYALSKVQFEQDLAELADDRFSPVCLRNATVYGASPRLRLDLVVNNLTAWAVTTGKVRILSDGTPWRPLIHVEDVCRAFLAMLEAPREKVHQRAFNVGANQENYQVKQVAEIVRETIPGCEIEYAGQGGPDPRNYRVDFSLLATAFPQWETRWDVRRGVRQLAQAYRRFGLTAEDLSGRRFIRLNQLKHLLATGAVDEKLYWTR